VATPIASASTAPPDTPAVVLPPGTAACEEARERVKVHDPSGTKEVWATFCAASSIDDTTLGVLRSQHDVPLIVRVGDGDLWSSTPSSQAAFDTLRRLRDVSSVHSVLIYGAELKSLEALRDVPSLERVQIMDLPVGISLAPLCALPRLREVKIYSAPELSSLRELACLGPRLEQLSIDQAAKLADITALSGFTALRGIHLSNVPVADLTPLQAARGLEEVFLIDIGVSDLAFLNGLGGLTSLHVIRAPLRDLNGLSGATALTTFGLIGAPVESLEPLSALSRLNTLMLSDLEHANFAPVGQLASLRELEINRGDLAGFSVAKLVELRKLTVASTTHFDTKGMDRLVNLEFFNGKSSGLRSIAFLRRSTKLQHVYVAANPDLRDLSPLAGLRDLRTVNAARTGVASIASLSRASELRHVWLCETGVKDLRALDRLEKLQILNPPTSLPPAQLDSFRKKHPSTQIMDVSCESAVR